MPLLREDFFIGDRYYLVMDWVDGVDLGRILATTPPDERSLDTLRPHIVDVAHAIDHLHAHDPPIVHRDIKPANIVVTSQRAVLVDFGLSMVSSTSDRSGSEGFVAPEITLGERATPAADIFSFTATIYTMLNGELPESGAVAAWAGAPSEQRERIASAVSGGLAFDPSRRPRSALTLVSRMGLLA
jgi:serine/threonine protein kinase